MTRAGGESRWLDDVSAAAVVLQPFVALFVVLMVVAPASPEQVRASDPLVQALRAWFGIGVIPVLCVAAGVAWWRGRTPSRAALMTAGRWALLAVAVVAIGLPLARVLTGPVLPAFVPPEEGARPGMLLSLGAGLVEEAIFRLGVLPAALVIGGATAAPRVATSGAVVVTALLFALSHEVGPGAGAFVPGYFLARFLIPGCAMSVLALWVEFSFVVALHCAAHVALPLLFP